MTNESGPVHQHNLLGADAGESRFGLRLTLPPGDTFGEILGNSWQKDRWFNSERERDQAISELRRQHPYYRLGDSPTLHIEKINRSASAHT